VLRNLHAQGKEFERLDVAIVDNAAVTSMQKRLAHGRVAHPLLVEAHHHVEVAHCIAVTLLGNCPLAILHNLANRLGLSRLSQHRHKQG